MQTHIYFSKSEHITVDESMGEIEVIIKAPVSNGVIELTLGGERVFVSLARISFMAAKK